MQGNRSTMMRPHGWGQQSRKLGVYDDKHRTTGTSRNQATLEQEILAQLLHCFILVGEIIWALSQTHLGSSHLLALWPWANHFVFLNFSLLTKTIGIITTYKWKGLEQHMIYKRHSTNSKLFFLPLPTPPFLLHFLPSTSYVWIHETLYLQLETWPYLLICESKTLCIGIWSQVQNWRTRPDSILCNSCLLWPRRGLGEQHILRLQMECVRRSTAFKRACGTAAITSKRLEQEWSQSSEL